MRRFFEVPLHIGIYVLTLLLAAVQIYDIYTRPLSLPVVIKKVIPSIVVIRCSEGTGHMTAGFIATDKGQIITVAHGVLSCETTGQITVRFPEDYMNEYPATIVKINKGVDAALLQVSFVPKAPPLQLDTKMQDVGSEVFTIGHPNYYFWSAEKGIVSANRINEYGLQLQVSCHISGGASGGPIFNQEGKVVGIAQSYADSATELGFAVPSFILKTLINGQ